MADQRFRKVRHMVTGEIGYLARVDAASFYVQTHLDYNLPCVHVLMAATGEIRIYPNALLEDVLV